MPEPGEASIADARLLRSGDDDDDGDDATCLVSNLPLRLPDRLLLRLRVMLARAQAQEAGGQHFWQRTRLDCGCSRDDGGCGRQAAEGTENKCTTVHKCSLSSVGVPQTRLLP